MMEIERKWLVDKHTMPSLENPEYQMANDVHPARIEQYYLNDSKDAWTIRARKSNDDCWLTLKSKGLLSREEIEIPITKEMFAEIIKHAQSCIKKTRYSFMYAGHKFEFDVYDDYDFITCEVEFKSEEEAKNFVAPACCMLDVTEDPEYKNVNLAK